VVQANQFSEHGSVTVLPVTSTLNPIFSQKQANLV
jgi:hypothetical protein